MAFWMTGTRASKIYFIPTDSIINVKTMFITWNKSKFTDFINAIESTVASMVQNPLLKNLSIPIDVDLIPTALANYPHVKTIGMYTSEFTRASRIKQIENVVTAYPNVNFTIFQTRDPQEPVLSNVAYIKLY